MCGGHGGAEGPWQGGLLLLLIAQPQSGPLHQTECKSTSFPVSLRVIAQVHQFLPSQCLDRADSQARVPWAAWPRSPITPWPWSPITPLATLAHSH